MAKKSINFYLFLLTSLIFFYSCKKENTGVYMPQENASAEKIKLLIGQVKNWHDSVVNIKSTPSSDSEMKSFSFSESSETIDIKTIKWADAYLSYDTIGNKGISVPLLYDSITGDYIQLVTSVDNKIVQGYIVKTAPTQSYYKIHKDRYDFTFFSGIVSVYDLKGKLINKIEFEDGELIQKNKLKNNQVSITTLDNLPKVTVTGYKHKPNHLALLPIESCATCGPPKIDPNGGSGNGVIFIGGNEADAFTPKIENFIKDTCLAKIVQKIIEKDLANAMSQKLLSIFDKSETMNLYFIDRSTNVDNSPGNFRVSPQKSGVSNYTIYLDLTKMPEASNEYKAAVIIHEITHAIIRTNLTSEGNSMMTHSEKHFIMLDKYIKQMKEFLQETFTLTDEEALSMIFAGIGDLAPEPDINYNDNNVFIKLLNDYKLSSVPGDMNSYTNINKDFFEGKKGNKNCN
ncbi:MAG: hypothetical protein ACOYKI_02970 [Sediminibacterium sp.]|jgi:hypothetical protein